MFKVTLNTGESFEAYFVQENYTNNAMPGMSPYILVIQTMEGNSLSDYVDMLSKPDALTSITVEVTEEIPAFNMKPQTNVYTEYTQLKNINVNFDELNRPDYSISLSREEK